MSLKFYKTPKEDHSWRSPVQDDTCSRYAAAAARAKKWLPPTLRFEQVVRNHTMPPCSLNDFMDYLVYVEQNAEPLQFFLWYCGYVQSWMELDAHERALVPRWDPADAEARAAAKADADRKRRGPRVAMSGRYRRARNASKVSNILEILDADGEEKEEKELLGSASPASSRPSRNFSRPSAPPGTVEAWISPPHQPFRDEVTQILNHYVDPSAPRSLGLTLRDRAAIADATAHTTHPTSLLPAFEKADAILRGHLHPNFIRSSIANTNSPTTYVLRVSAWLLLMLGFSAAAALNLCTARFALSRYWRIAPFALWAPGFAILVAAADGLSISLYFAGRRQLRPWEAQPTPAELEDASWRGRRAARRATAAASPAGDDPLRKPSLRTFGPGNGFRSEWWVRAYAKTGLWWRIFETTRPVGEGEVRVLQDGVVITAFIWAFVLAGGLAAGSVFVPAFDPWTMKVM
ncbi:hypothetical protein VD0004_g2331 [Verticillium dahliae]|uniref:RGS domain-containing protein n=1 Tax=Verticillium dahliae TaxID=27337 RepID=A0A444S1G1_VERDA|nr:hypothetical protein VD0004_g2331 [Verticillium dahliae]PNH75031.1 hypothetical protein VD0001_g2558 [Verticillium dahliae]RXG47237.1 hypothetical protein VDGE_07045 [Verticillium dahliae]